MLNITIPAQSRTREEWLHAFTDAARGQFAEAGAPLDAFPIRISIGFPSKGRRSKVIGECFHSSASADGAREIFIRPSLQSNVVEIAHVLTHELIHAALPDGEWHAWADPILEELGHFPGTELRDGIVAGGPKKQGTRLVKLECECGWTCRTTEKHITDDLQCPTGCDSSLNRS